MMIPTPEHPPNLMRLDGSQSRNVSVRKRDTRLVPFDESRIALAIEAAFKADAGLHRDQPLPAAARDNSVRVANAVICDALDHAARQGALEIEFIQDLAETKLMIEQSVELEIAYAEDCLPRGILGLNAALFREYVQHIADRRLERIGLPTRYGSKNPFPWMSETMDLGKEKNFFETRVTEYQSGGSLAW